VVHPRPFCLVAICAAALLASTPFPLDAKGHVKSGPPQDGIELVAHLPLTSAPVTHFVETQHYRRNYLYAETGAGSGVILIDVTDIGRPTIISTLGGSSETTNVIAAAGTAALVAKTPGPTRRPADTQTFRIMSFADPQHPTVKQEFANVSAFSRDESRGLIFLANPEGIWILHEKLATDPESEREWEHMTLDNR